MRGTINAGIKGSVLIADDHAVYRIGLRELLRRRFNLTRFHEATCFSEVPALLEADEVTLAIIDLRMPDLSVPRDIARLRALYPDMRVVVVSGSDAREDILNALSAGVHGYIVKSQPSDELIEKLRYILSGEIYVPPVLAQQPIPSVQGQGAPSGIARPHADLSDRQRQVLQGLVEGKSNKEIAKALKVAEGTVKMHLSAVFRALGATNRAHAAALGKRLIG
jgi:DNA-binding NarL/FixJ family response regulator